jgi:hypothetical protein
MQNCCNRNHRMLRGYSGWRCPWARILVRWTPRHVQQECIRRQPGHSSTSRVSDPPPPQPLLCIALLSQAIEACIHSALPRGRWQLRIRCLRCGGHHRCSGAVLGGNLNTTAFRSCNRVESVAFVKTILLSAHTVTQSVTCYVVPTSSSIAVFIK